MSRIISRKYKVRKILKSSSGFLNSNLYKEAKQKYIKSLSNQYIARKIKKRFFRKRWIKQISTALKAISCKYSLFISSLKKQKITLNRKILYLIFLYDLSNTK